MSKGYSLRLRDLNRRESGRYLGVRLGRVCIKHDIPVTEVARRMVVTRQTVYNWFVGYSHPAPGKVSEIEQYIKSFAE
jgi:hypothetical protein